MIIRRKRRRQERDGQARMQDRDGQEIWAREEGRREEEKRERINTGCG